MVPNLDTIFIKPHVSSSFSFVQIDIEERNVDNYLSAGEVRLLFFLIHSVLNPFTDNRLNEI